MLRLTLVAAALLSTVYCTTVSRATAWRLVSTPRPPRAARCAAPSMLYQRGADSGSFVDEDRVRSLIMERDRLRKEHDFDGADGV